MISSRHHPKFESNKGGEDGSKAALQRACQESRQMEHAKHRTHDHVKEDVDQPMLIGPKENPPKRIEV